MSVALPYATIGSFITGLEYTKGRGMCRYPVPRLPALAELRIPETYFQIDPDL